MTTHENGAINAPEWQIEPKFCPIPCGICETPQQAIWMHGDGLDIPDTIELGSE